MGGRIWHVKSCSLKHDGNLWAMIGDLDKSFSENESNKLSPVTCYPIIESMECIANNNSLNIHSESQIVHKCTNSSSFPMNIPPDVVDSSSPDICLL